MAVISLNEGIRVLNVIPQVNYAVRVTADQNGMAATVNAEGKLFLLGNGEVLTTLDTPAVNEIFTCCTFREDGKLYAGTSGNEILVYEVTGTELKLLKRIACGRLANLQTIVFAEEEDIRQISQGAESLNVQRKGIRDDDEVLIKEHQDY